MKLLFDYFWKPICPFSNLVLTVFWCSTVIIVFWMLLMGPLTAFASWWRCARLNCVFDLRRPGKFELFGTHTCLGPSLKYCCSDINEKVGVDFLFYFVLLVNIVALFVIKSFFICRSGFCVEVFSYCSVTETFAVRFQNWFDIHWVIFGLFSRICFVLSTSYLHRLTSARIAQMLFFFDDIKSFR